MGQIKVCKFIIVKSKPLLEDFTGDFNAYVLVQPIPGKPPTELYFVNPDPNYPFLQFVSKDNIDSLITKAISPTTNYDYTGITILTLEQEKSIELMTNFSAQKARQRAMVIAQRVKNGILASHIGNPITMNKSACFVFHCDLYNDGNGDVGNVMDVVKHIIEYNKNQNNINLYFVLTASNLKEYKESNKDTLNKACQYFIGEITNLFNKYPSISFNINKNLFTFPRCDSTYDGLNEESIQFNLLVNTKQELRKVYENADAIFNIATPFPALPESIKLKSNTQIINITEHNASSLWFYRQSVPTVHHYVTGIKSTSGLMIEDLSCDMDGSIKALQSIEDSEYIHKLGLSYPVSTTEAARFLKTTLVVPVYLGEMQQANLAPLIYMVSQSPLANSFKKIIFHINQRSYNPDIFKEKLDELQKKYGLSLDKVQLIIGHFFMKNEDLGYLYQLSSDVGGIAIISSDKVLELAISCGLLPIYPPVPWKKSIYRDFCDLVKDNQDYTQLQLFLGKIDEPASILNSFDNNISLFLNQELLNYWTKVIRPVLLEQSFYRILQSKILGTNAIHTPVVNHLHSSPSTFFQPPFQMLSDQIRKLFFIQVNDLKMNPNMTLLLSTQKITNENLVAILKKCNAKLSYSDEIDKYDIKIQGPKDIRRFLVELGFQGPILEKLGIELGIETPKLLNDEMCIVM